MTLAMPDSVRVADLPPGYPAYLGYADGRVIPPTEPALRKRFPGARLVILTTTGATTGCDGADIEPGNLTAKDGAQWARQRINRQPGFRPVLYASVVGDPGYGMGDVLTALAANKITRGQVRLLAAHWGMGEHICGPRTCGQVSTDMDGTQWTNQYPATGIDRGSIIDMSALRDDFFGNETEAWVQQLGIVRQGDTGETVRTVQGLCNARGFMGSTIKPVTIDGIFGRQTEMAVQAGQAHAGITRDGVVGPQTWPVLLGIS